MSDEHKPAEELSDDEFVERYGYTKEDAAAMQHLAQMLDACADEDEIAATLDFFCD